jgi:hypothetical protein
MVSWETVIRNFLFLLDSFAGTHHTADVDMLPNRGTVPWGALFNSCKGLRKVKANLRVDWVRSPHFDLDIHNDGNDMEGFLVTKRPIKKGEELLWFYDVSQAHRSIKVVPSTILAVSTLASDTFECRCSTTCVGTCINAPLPQNATRARKKRKIDD